MNEHAIHTYLDESLLPYFYCPGCGHGIISDQLNATLVRLQLDPHKVVIVTDIGCSGLADKYFTTNTFHGLHGRSVTYATGIKLANPELKVIVLMGDGGCGIGGHHLINAARRNIGVSVIVFDNFNYGMTGGEHSVTTPPGGITSSTPFGQLEQPMDICQTVAINGASFVARTTAFDKGMPELLASAIQNEGFSLVDIWELCTAYYVPNNRFSKGLLEKTLEQLKFPTGVFHQAARPEYSHAYRQSLLGEYGKPIMSTRHIQAKYASQLDKRLGIVIAGAAGKKINSSAALFVRGAVLSGLWATQRNDYPVTVKAGHSVSEVILAPREIGYTGIIRPNVMLLLFREGLGVVRSQLETMTEQDVLFVNSELLPVKTQARVVPLDFKQAGGVKKENWTLVALARMLRETEIFPLEALKEAVSGRVEYAEENLKAIEVGTVYE
ncbi:MAG TPA: thiamine pyrophosphate-dependent enzyme [Anaerolineales bacterium]|nr:thiamine pyrophosphate-dependent enzyme [Anaerolineales bacterium]